MAETESLDQYNQQASLMLDLTVTQRKQKEKESHIFSIYYYVFSRSAREQNHMLRLKRDEHIEYLNGGLRQLPSSFCCFDANRPWLCYWMVHSLALLGEVIDDNLEDNAIAFLSRCQDVNGGYGGGPGQLPHLATTYAAVNSLITLGSEKALSSINRQNIYKFLLHMKVASGGFSMHEAGEVDIRACYTAISVASVLNILDEELVRGVGDFVLRLQTYEGGLSGEPGTEAHGGYSFCGLATMILIDEAHRLDLPRFLGGVSPLLQRLGSVVNKQLGLDAEEHTSNSTGDDDLSDISESETGNAGESSQVDRHFHSDGEVPKDECCKADLSNMGSRFLERPIDLPPLFETSFLQNYILFCCQDQEGGLRDKPGAHRDYYHTCYCLSGLSVCQNAYSKRVDSSPLPSTVQGPYSNVLEPIHPLYGVVLDKYRDAHDFFSSSQH